MVTGARRRDRYDEPCDVLNSFTGFGEEPQTPMLISNLHALKPWAKLNEDAIVGPRGKLLSKMDPVGTFNDNSPLHMFVSHLRGGSVYRLSYIARALLCLLGNRKTPGSYPTKFSDELRRKDRGAAEEGETWTDYKMVETPLLLSDHGAAITLLKLEQYEDPTN